MSISTRSFARWSGANPWKTIGAWVAFLVASGVLIVGLLPSALTTDFAFLGNPESKRADDLLKEKMQITKQGREIIIVRSGTLSADDGTFREAIAEITEDVRGLGPEIIQSITDYTESGDPSLVSQDRSTTILPLTMAGSFDAAADNIDAVWEVVHRADQRERFDVLMTGRASIASESNHLAETDLQRGEGIGIPVALIILVLVFGALAAASIPLVLAIVAIAVSLGITALIGQAYELSFFVTNMITMMGLAVGIDYSLFVVSRYREERIAGLEKIDAIERAGATASRAVFFSGLTVVLALVGLLIVPTSIFQSLAIGAILVVMVAVAGSLTLIPALLGVVGDRVNALRIPFVGRPLAPTSGNGNKGFWNWITYTVMRRPVISIIVTATILVAAATPALDIETGAAGVSTLPDALESKQGFLLLEEHFAFGVVSPARIVVDGDMSAESTQLGIQQLRERIASDADFLGTREPVVSADESLGYIDAAVAGDSTSPATIDAIKRLRNEYIPEAFAGATAEVLVTGDTAGNLDFFEITDRYTPIVFGFVLGLSFLLLTVVFRSIVIPIKAIAMNLLSVGAAYGLMVLVSQKGIGAGVLGFQQVPTIDAWIPLFLFAVLFGLSMDYHVFLLSRIRERYDRTGDNAESVAYGLRTTARLITGAALIMVVVFGGFASGDMVMFQQVGFGLGVAVLLDATIVRSILVPASMKLLGNLNWYLPSALHWLPDIRPEAGEMPVATVGFDTGASDGD